MARYRATSARRARHSARRWRSEMQHKKHPQRFEKHIRFGLESIDAILRGAAPKAQAFPLDIPA